VQIVSCTNKTHKFCIDSDFFNKGVIHSRVPLYEGETDLLLATSWAYTIAAYQIFSLTTNPLPSGSYNAELVKPLRPEMQVKIENYENTRRAVNFFWFFPGISG
jgi:hypothetical protein